ncbi:tRNA-splicing endonuclease subunit Sen2-1-like isoform X2 [Tasmannia lanceolata]
MELTGPRWKRKDSALKALADPMSKIVKELQSSLLQSKTHSFLSGCDVLLEASSEQTDLLNHACFGRPIATTEKDKQWFQLGLEEAFYMHHALKCLTVVGENDRSMNEEEIWESMKSKRKTFPDLYRAYLHLRSKNWVVRPGTPQYGVDFVIYRHHPALVHSEYAVIVLSEGDGDLNDRLRVWSDLQCTLRLCGSVAKTLLVLNINKNGKEATFPSCLEVHSIDERTITRWVPEQCREDCTNM